ncbi:MAG: hypothetical protein WCG97_01770 [bacterium]
MKKKIFKFICLYALTILPSSMALAATSTFAALINQFIGYVRMLIPFIIALTILVFLWGVFKLIWAGDSDAAVTEGKVFITWGIVSLFVMVSVWGLVRIFTKTFFDDQFFIPQLRTTMLIEHSDVNRV